MFTKYLDTCAPTVTKAMKGTAAPWMTDEISEAMQGSNELKKIKKMKVDHDNSLLRERYTTAKNHVKNLNEKYYIWPLPRSSRRV